MLKATWENFQLGSANDYDSLKDWNIVYNTSA